MTQLTTTGQPTPAEIEFQQKMQDRLRAAMGDLMPDEVLKGIVARGIEEAFFKPRVERTGYYNEEKKYPSWLVAFAEAETRKQVEFAVTNWFADNQSRVKELVEQSLKEGLAAAVVQAANYVFSRPLEELRESLTKKFEGLATR